uniref:Kinesin light chain n=1 Tax=Odontella aurita TaxID=265563 RepID=A0A7S4JI47_9STRA|mmetsp:Transcript_46808/g.141780  ORF Transcript_46808/g.141780 Transcript_46808/m.141780 type:complete len:264 (+) Transcript_46808:307-1098(+)
MGSIRRLIARRRAKNDDVGANGSIANDVNYVASMFALGEAKARMGLLNEGIACWTRAVVVARRRMSNDVKKDKIAASSSQALLNIGDAFVSRGLWDEALAAWNEALRAKRILLDNEWHPDMAQILNKIGVAFSHSTADGDHTYSALMAFEKALEMQQDTLGPGHRDCVETANNICKLLDEVRRRECAIADISNENEESVDSETNTNTNKTSVFLLGDEISLSERGDKIQAEEKTVDTEEDGTVDLYDEELSHEGVSLEVVHTH